MDNASRSLVMESFDYGSDMHIIEDMPKRSSKSKKRAKSIPPNLKAAVEAEDKKNPHAVILGRLGGLKGGKARAKKLSAERRREIARKAAKARWTKKSSRREEE